MIEDDAAFGWMRAVGRGPNPGDPGPGKTKERSTNERLLEVLTDEQARRWRDLTGEPVKGPLVPFGAPAPAQRKANPKAAAAPPP